MEIPFDEFCDYIRNNIDISLDNEEKMKEYHNWQYKKFEKMKKFTWEYFEKLSKEELERIPYAWLYDWMHVTSNFEFEGKIEELYTKHNLKILSPKEYLEKFDKMRYYDDIHKILPHPELKNYIKNFLIDNKEFINDVDSCMWGQSSDNKLINKTIKERHEYFDNTIGNESRTYILKILTLKHLSKILLNNIDGFTDEFWRDRLNKVL